MFHHFKPAYCVLGFVLMTTLGFAGEVRVVVNGLGNVTITGGNTSDHFALSSFNFGGVDRIRITAFAGTTFTLEGQTYDSADGFVVLPDTTSSSTVLLNLLDGDDYVRVSGLKVKTLRALMGRGHDAFDAPEIYASLDLTIEGGPGDFDDVAIVGGAVERNLRVGLGAGQDACSTGTVFPLTVGGRLTISQFAGESAVSISQTAVFGAASISLGAWDDFVSVDLSAFQSLYINAGPNDIFQPVTLYAAVVLNNLTVIGGSQEDYVDFASSIFAGNVLVNNGSGNDNTSIFNTDFLRNVTVNSGIGDDQISLQGDPTFTADSNIRMNTGPGDDVVETFGTVVNARSLSVSTGGGDDVVNWWGTTTTLVGPPRFIGGAGDDFMLRGNFSPQVSIIGFEAIAF